MRAGRGPYRWSCGRRERAALGASGLHAGSSVQVLAIGGLPGALRATDRRDLQQSAPRRGWPLRPVGAGTDEVDGRSQRVGVADHHSVTAGASAATRRCHDTPTPAVHPVDDELSTPRGWTSRLLTACPVVIHTELSTVVHRLVPRLWITLRPSGAGGRPAPLGCPQAPRAAGAEPLRWGLRGAYRRRCTPGCTAPAAATSRPPPLPPTTAHRVGRRDVSGAWLDVRVAGCTGPGAGAGPGGAGDRSGQDGRAGADVTG